MTPRLRLSLALGFLLVALLALGFPAACEDGPHAPMPASVR